MIDIRELVGGNRMVCMLRRMCGFQDNLCRQFDKPDYPQKTMIVRLKRWENDD